VSEPVSIVSDADILPIATVFVDPIVASSRPVLFVTVPRRYRSDSGGAVCTPFGGRPACRHTPV